MRAATIAVGAILITTPVAAQPSGRLAFDVPIQWTLPAADASSQRQDIGAEVALDHLFAKERGKVFYEMTLDSFGAPDALRTWLHNAGVVATLGGENRALDLGGSVFWRANDGAWADAGFRGVNVMASARTRFSPVFMMTSSYGLYARAFPDEPALDQIEHFGSVRWLANFPTHTTLVGAVSLGRKSYDGREAVIVVDETLPASGVTDPTHIGRGWRQGLMVPVSIDVTGEPGARTSWTWAARLAQSLDDRTGVWIEREERRTRGELPPAIVWTPPLFYDDGVYDDPYVIDAKTWRAGAKHLFERGDEVSGWVSYSDRSYAGLTRADTLTRAGVEVVTPLVNGVKASLEALTRYSWFRNASSDPLEGYRAHQLSVGLRVGF